MLGLSSHFQELEDLLHYKVIPALTGNPTLNDLECELFALPAREGGLTLYLSVILSTLPLEPPLSLLLKQSCTATLKISLFLV